MEWYEIVILILILLISVGAYLREHTYRNVHGKATIGRDIADFWEGLRRWRRIVWKERVQKYPKEINSNGKERQIKEPVRGYIREAYSGTGTASGGSAILSDGE